MSKLLVLLLFLCFISVTICVSYSCKQCSRCEEQQITENYCDEPVYCDDEPETYCNDDYDDENNYEYDYENDNTCGDGTNNNNSNGNSEDSSSSSSEESYNCGESLKTNYCNGDDQDSNSDGSCSCIIDMSEATTEDSTDTEEKTTEDSSDKEGTSTPLVETTTENYECEAELDNFQDAVLQLTPKMLSIAIRLKPLETVLISALSPLSLLLQILPYAEGKTKAELLEALNLNDSDDEKAQCILRKIKEMLTNLPSGVTYDAGNFIIANDQFKLTDKFKNDVMENVYGGEALNLRFGNSFVNETNELTKSKTNNAVTDVFKSSNDVSNFTQLVFVTVLNSVIEFNTTFDPKLIKSKDFYVGPFNIVAKDYYNQINIFNYGIDKKLGCELLEIPFTSEEFSLLICLPIFRSGLNDVLKNLENTELLNAAVKNMKRETVELFLPVLKANTTIDVRKAFVELNLVPSLLSPEKAELKGVVKQDKTVSLSVARQKTMMESTNKGEYPPPNIERQKDQKVFDCSYAFVFYIMNNGIAVHAGVFAQ